MGLLVIHGVFVRAPDFWKLPSIVTPHTRTPKRESPMYSNSHVQDGHRAPDSTAVLRSL